MIVTFLHESYSSIEQHRGLMVKYAKVSIIIPVHNEAPTLEILIRKVQAASVAGLKKEIVLIDDGSTDRSPEILEKYMAQHIVLRNSKNRGKGAALRMGFVAATGDIIITQDADLEYSPNEYEKLLEPILSGKHHVVYGSRFKTRLRNPNPRTRVNEIANRTLSRLTNVVLKTKLTDMETGHKAISAKALHKIQLISDDFRIEPEITCKLVRSGFEIHEVPVNYAPRLKKDGKKLKWRDGPRALHGIFQFGLRSRG